MSRKLMSLALFGMVLTLVYAFGTPAQAACLCSDDQIRVDRDFGSFTIGDTNSFGDDRAYSSPTRGTDRDADSQYFQWTPDTYGLKGTYGYYSNGAG